MIEEVNEELLSIVGQYLRGKFVHYFCFRGLLVLENYTCIFYKNSTHEIVIGHGHGVEFWENNWRHMDVRTFVGVDDIINVANPQLFDKMLERIAYWRKHVRL